ncbi:hypothetical protein [Amycolatopsis orientalis]|uniref:hypothetical protein n=1 Tax=Amycolatopsis orientalis TaxID=31958 RepID=UPI00190F93F6|nr:hypothetical protein [Amycolatopsis orientalis]
MKTEHDVLARLRTRAEAVLGRETAARVRASEDGTLYVEARTWAAFRTWLVDLLLVVAIAVGGAVACYRHAADEPNAAAGSGSARRAGRC